MTKKFLHEASNEEIKEFIDKKESIQYLSDNYKQPDWCKYQGALNGTMGCWSLMDFFDKRHLISIEWCRDCPEFKKNLKNENI